MAKPFDNNEAKRIIEEHNRILDSLIKIKSSRKTFYSNIKNVSDRIVIKEVLKVLQGIPVEELNRDRIGIRVKLLKENGYDTIADLAPESAYSIASIYGIGEETAQTIKNITNSFVNKTRQEVKISISTDNKTEDSTLLVTAVYIFSILKPTVKPCKNLLSNKIEIQNAIKTLENSPDGIKWFFLSKKRKQEVIDSFYYLSGLAYGDYRKEAEKVISYFNSISFTDDNVWDWFSSNPIKFYNILEKVNPGILGNNDELYGLPEDLAREVQEECYFPDGLLCELRRYQEWGVKYILHQEKVLLGDEMGLGKTVQAIATMVSLRNTGGTHFLVVCPASVITNWCREIKQKSKLSVTKIHGNDRKQSFDSWIKTGGVAVTTFETTSHLKTPDNFKITEIIVDEAHYIKNPEANRTVNVKELCKHADRILFMTGTALENKVDEMISLIDILQPNIASAVQNMKFLSSAPQFRKAIAPVYYRRKREDVLSELPELIENYEWCSLNSIEEMAYEKAVLSKNYAESRRVSWNIDDIKYSSKANRLMEIVNEAESEGRKIIIFSFFLDTIRKVTSLLEDRCLKPIIGSVSPQHRQEIIDEFNNSPAGTVLAAQIQSGGTGLNIQSASVIIICEPQFKPSIENQAIARAYRMGQTRSVLVYRLLCENTVDEKIMSVLQSKQQLFDAFADKSVAALDSLEMDTNTFGNIINEEIERINNKNAGTGLII